MKQKFLCAGLVSLGVALLSAIAPAGAQTTSITVGPAAQRANPFATQAARLAARPMPLYIAPSGGNGVSPAAGALPGRSPSGSPNRNADAEAQRTFASEWQQSAASSASDTSLSAAGVDFGTAGVYTHYFENQNAVNRGFPQRAIGKLFFTTPSGGSSCSASVISGNNVIVTAAHCCHSRTAWYSNWSFAPAYRNGAAPYGTFNATTAWVLTAWINTGARWTDVCVINLANNSAGRGVTFYTGWLGRSWNWGAVQNHHAVGYPGNRGGGNYQYLCTAESFAPGAGCGTDVLNQGCAGTYGQSGGPWIRSYRGNDWVNSVVSGWDSAACTGAFGTTFNGPRFTTNNIVTLCNSAGC
jgi:V8-like Glu-specific endopeptidase